MVVLACESLHVCTVCIWRCEHARFLYGSFFMRYIYIFIHSSYDKVMLPNRPINVVVMVEVVVMVGFVFVLFCLFVFVDVVVVAIVVVVVVVD